MGAEMSENAAFAVAGTCAIVFVGASCYFEEYAYKSLPNFDYYWTVALAELMVFALISSASSIADGTLFAKRKAPLELYALQASLLAAYSAVGKLCYKWINYATGTVLRSSKLVFTMAISAVWLRRTYKPHQVVAASLLVVAVAFFGIAERELGSNEATMPTPATATTNDGEAGFGVVGRREVGSGIRVVRGGDLFGIAADERVRARDAELRSGRARKYPVHERHRYRVCVLICRHIRRLGVDHVPSHGQGRVRPALRSLGDVLFRRLLLLDAHQALRRHLRHRRHHRPQSPDGDLILHPIPQRQAFRWIFRLRFVLLPPQRLGREFAPHPSVFPSRARGKTRRVLALIPNSGRSQAHIVALVIQIVRT